MGETKSTTLALQCDTIGCPVTMTYIAEDYFEARKKATADNWRFTSAKRGKGGGMHMTCPACRTAYKKSREPKTEEQKTKLRLNYVNRLKPLITKDIE